MSTIAWATVGHRHDDLVGGRSILKGPAHVMAGSPRAVVNDQLDVRETVEVIGKHWSLLEAALCLLERVLPFWVQARDCGERLLDMTDARLKPC